MKNALAFALLFLVAALALPTAASAGCTASFTCSNACSIESYFCPRPYPPCELSCFASNQVVSCTGNSVCSVGTNSVTCDGVTKTCSSNWCTQSTYSVRCGNTTRSCTYNCPL